MTAWMLAAMGALSYAAIRPYAGRLTAYAALLVLFTTL